MTGAAANLAAGVLFGIGNLALLGLVSRVGTGVGFTIGQLSLLVNASIGIWVFKVPHAGVLVGAQAAARRPGANPRRFQMHGGMRPDRRC